MKGKKIAIPIFLVVGLGVSIYLWTAGGEEGSDNEVMKQQMSYTCANCNHQFSMSVEDSTNMRRSRGDIYCPSCNQAAAQKADVKIDLGAPKFGDKKADEDSGDQAPEDPRPKAGGGATKIN